MVRVIIISNDNSIKTAISDELKKNGVLEVITSLSSVDRVGEMLLSDKLNALIVDDEIRQETSVYFENLSKDFDLKVFLFGKSGTAFNLKDGLFNFAAKPLPGDSASLRVFCMNISTKLTALLQAKMTAQTLSDPLSLIPVNPPVQPADLLDSVSEIQKIVAIASSTGGTEALPIVLQIGRAHV